MPRGGNNWKAHDLKVLEGRTGGEEDQPPRYKPIFPTEPGADLPEAAREFWQKYASALNRTGILTEVDEPAFYNMAMTYNTIKECEQQIQQEGLLIDGARGGKVKNPLISVLNQARQLFRLQCQSFGLDGPSSRERLNVQPVNDDEIESLLTK